MGMEVWQLLPLVVLECGLSFGCMAAILGGSFYVMAFVCALLSLLLAVAPDVGPLIFGVAFAVGLLRPRLEVLAPGAGREGRLRPARPPPAFRRPHAVCNSGATPSSRSASVGRWHVGTCGNR